MLADERLEYGVYEVSDGRYLGVAERSNQLRIEVHSVICSRHNERSVISSNNKAYVCAVFGPVYGSEYSIASDACWFCHDYLQMLSQLEILIVAFLLAVNGMSVVLLRFGGEMTFNKSFL